MTSHSLSRDDRARLTELERVVEAGLATFIEVGEALAQIRDQRLYEATHRTWESYLDDRWSGLSRSYAHRLIAAAGVAAVLPPGNTTPAPTTEAQVRPLTALRDDPTAVTDAWQEAVTAAGGATPTPALVRDAVQRRRPSPPRKPQPVADYRCRTCGKAGFQRRVRHCPDCGAHYGDTDCPNDCTRIARERQRRSRAMIRSLDTLAALTDTPSATADVVDNPAAVVDRLDHVIAGLTTLRRHLAGGHQ